MTIDLEKGLVLVKAKLRSDDLNFHKDIGSDVLLDCNDELVFQQEAVC
jgi:hypothetical protein